MLAILLCVFQKLTAQRLVFSDFQKSKGRNFQMEIEQADSSGILVLRKREKFLRRFLELERYNSKLQLLDKVQIPFESEILGSCFSYGEKIYVLSNVFDRLTRRAATRVRILNESLKLQKKTLLDTVFQTTQFYRQLHTFYSKNEKIYSISITNGQEKETCILRIKEFNLALEKVQEILIPIAYNKTFLSVQNILESKNGNLFLACSKAGKKYQSNFVLVVNLRSTAYQKIDLFDKKIEGNFAPIMQESPFSSHIYLATSFTKNDGYDLGNLMLLRMLDSVKANPVEKILSRNYITSDKNAEWRRAKKRYNELVPKNFMFFSDSSIVLLSEEIKESSYTYIDYVNNVPVTRNQMVYFYGNVIFEHFDNELIISHRDTFFKEQTSSNDKGMFSSFALIHSLSKPYLLFNSATKDFGISKISFNQEGFQSIHSINREEFSVGSFFPKQVKQLPDGSFYLQLFVRGKMALVKVDSLLNE